MKTIYPKSAIQKVIEIHARILYQNVPSNSALDDYFHDHYRELADAFAYLAMCNDSEDDADITKYSKKWEKAIEPIIVDIFDAVMEDLNFVREQQDDLVADVLREEESAG